MMKRYPILLVLVLGLFLVLGCEEATDDDDDDVTADPWVGLWLSTGENVAPILVTYFQYDSVEVTFNEDATVVLRSHAAGGAWTENTGTYTITESDASEIDVIHIEYTSPAFVQDGIIQIDGDDMTLEAVQTDPSIGATVPTVAVGFGNDPLLGATNVQRYVRQ